MFGTLWVTGPFGPYEELALRSLVASGEPVELYTYDAALTAPSGVTVLDAQDIVPEARLHSFPGSFAHFSNLFRYRLLSDRPRIWVDTDLVLLDVAAIPDRSHLYALQSNGRINTALLALPMDSPALPLLVAGSDVPEGTKLRWGRLGPDLLTATLEALGLRDRALPVPDVYPIGWQDIWRLFDPDQFEWCQERTRGSAALHLWNQYLKKDGLKEFAPPPGSYLGEVASALDVEFRSSPAPRALLDQVRRKRTEGGQRRERRVAGLLRSLRSVPRMLIAREWR